MIATVFALEFESAAFRSALGPRLCMTVWTLGVTGERSAAGLERMIANARPKLIVSAGFSGALQPDLQLGDIVIGENFSDARILAALPVFPEFRRGRVLTVPDILETGEAKRQCGMESGALAGDLESEHLHRVCLAAGIPMLSVRTVSDTMEQDLPLPGNILIDPTSGRSDPGSIFRYLFRHPTKAAGFAKLVADAKSAQVSLAQALGQILPLLVRSSG